MDEEVKENKSEEAEEVEETKVDNKLTQNVLEIIENAVRKVVNEVLANNTYEFTKKEEPKEVNDEEYIY